MRSTEVGVLIPDHETAVDFLNYEAIANTVVALLKDNRQHALTIGIHATAKSSAIKTTKAISSGARERLITSVRSSRDRRG